jgi:hypothetical protein
VEKNSGDGNDETDENQNQNDCSLDDLLNLINQDDEGDDIDIEKQETNVEDQEKLKELPTEKKKLKLKKSQHLTQQKVNNEDEDLSPSRKELKTLSKSSITITKISNDADQTLIEKNTNLNLIKSPFKNEIELNMRLMCDIGKFLKLTDVNRRAIELKETGAAFKWFSIFILGSKTESKSSAKGNNYVIWRIFDSNNLDKQQDISLFLFGNAYKTHWKSSEFEAFALVQPDVLESNKNTNTASSTNNNTYFNHTTSNFTNNKKSGNYGSGYYSKKFIFFIFFSLLKTFQIISYKLEQICC